MFGYVVANLDQLDEQQKKLYRGTYCGLCRALGAQHGLACRATLTYDMTFLILLLSSLQEEKLSPEPFRCAVHPLTRQESCASVYTPYAADMNLLLAYAQRMDGWQDDRSLLSLSQAKLIGRNASQLRSKYPRQAQAIDEGLKALAALEKDDESNPDLPANAFGYILGEVFVPDTDHPQADGLRAMGFSLGRFIYLMDAAMDLKEDILKERYNPLVFVPSQHHEEILNAVMAQCADCFEALPVQHHKQLLENILYSGVWTRYMARQQKEGHKK